MKVRVTILGGVYANAPSWEGSVYEIPVTMLPPEGIESARTITQNADLRVAVSRALSTADVVELSSAQWRVRIRSIE